MPRGSLVKASTEQISDLRTVARDFAARSIVTEAVARLVEQILLQVHVTRIAPLEAEIAALKSALAEKT